MATTQKTSYPKEKVRILFLENISGDVEQAYVIVEKNVFMHLKSSNLICMISTAIKIFYALNMLYPKNISQTMEFFVKFYYKYYCDTTRGLIKKHQQYAKG